MTPTTRPVSTAAARRGRPPRISLDEVIRVASVLSAERGVDELTIRAVAEQLGTTRAAIYHYVGGTAELRRLVTVVAMSPFDFAAPRSAPWQDWVVEFARALRTWRLAHADADPYLYVSAEVVLGDGFLAPIEALLDVLAGAGFTDDLAASAVQFLAGTVWINTQDQIMALTSEGGVHPQRAAMVGAAGRLEGYPRISAAIDQARLFESFDQRFETEVRWVVAALEGELSALG